MQVQCPIEIGGKTSASQAVRLYLPILSEINKPASSWYDSSQVYGITRGLFCHPF